MSCRHDRRLLLMQARRMKVLFQLLLVGTFVTGGRTAHSADPNGAIERAPIPAVLTTDVGAEVDDQWAMAHLLVSPEVDLKAIITTHARLSGLTSRASAEKANEVVAHVLSDRHSPHPRIQAGSTHPLVDAATPREGAGVDLLLSVSKSYAPSHRLTVFVTGAATDVASAILRDPSIASRIKIVAMAFGDWPAGGDVFNVANDPAAWTVILDSDVPVIVGSFAVTGKALRVTRAEARSLMAERGSIGEYLYSQFADWLNWSRSLVEKAVGPDTWVIWDEVVVAYALGMASGEEVPRPKLNADLSFSHPDTQRRITWLTHIDTDHLWRDFTQKLENAQKVR
jgi:purine nucleosidase